LAAFGAAVLATFAFGGALGPLALAGFLLFFVPVLGHLISWLAYMVVSLGFFVIWVVLIVKALQGEMFKLPWVGDFAKQKIAVS